MDFKHILKTRLSFLKWKDYEINETGSDFLILFLDRKYVLRIPKTQTYRQILQSEVRFNQFLQKEKEVAIPNYFHLAKDHSFGIYNYISGEPLNKLDNEKEENIVAEKLALFLKNLHQVDLKTIESLGVKPNYYLKKSIDALILEQKDYLKGFLNEKEQDAVKKELLNHREIINRLETENKLIHGDLSLENILWDKTKLQLGILDFSDRNVSDPAFDFSELFTLGEDFVRKMMDHYSGKEQLFQAARFYFRIRPLLRIHAYQRKQTNKTKVDIQRQISLLKSRLA